jgi:hypothetical protein
MKKLIYVGLLCSLVTLSDFAVIAAEKKPAAPADEKQPAKPRAIPFRGKVAAVDKQAQTLKVGERVFQITAETRITKAGKPATLNDAVVGEEIGGQYRNADGGKLEAVMVRLGAKPEEAAKEKKEEK